MTIPVVQISSGRLAGVARAGDHAYLGVPFAEPPVGALRFAPPRPAEPWEGTRPATSFGATPLRVEAPSLIPEPAIPGESTLNVNVFTPDPSPDARLPVLVWIHGGGYTGGSPASPWYDGAAFSRAGIVTVVVSYRLGFDGFGAIPGGPCNLAVQDWLLALEWVQRNIAAFGGDPGRVTLGGQSAGAGAVLTLLGMPRASGLFRAAWASSPVLPVRTRDDAEATALRLARRLGIAAGAGSAAGSGSGSGSGAGLTAALAALPEARVLAEQGAAARAHGLSLSGRIEREPAFSPIVDGELVPEPTLAALGRGVGADIPVVIGSNDHEIVFPDGPLLSLVRHAPSRLVLRATGVSGEALQEYASAQASAGVADGKAALEQEISDRVFRRNVVRVAEARRAAPDPERDPDPDPGPRPEAAPTRAYRFAWPSPTKGAAIHCLDVPFLWNVLDHQDVSALAGERPPRELADALHGAVVAHVLGDPAPWPAWDGTRRRVAVLGGAAGTVAVQDDGYASLAALVPEG